MKIIDGLVHKIYKKLQENLQIYGLNTTFKIQLISKINIPSHNRGNVPFSKVTDVSK